MTEKFNWESVFEAYKEGTGLDIIDENIRIVYPTEYDLIMVPVRGVENDDPHTLFVISPDHQDDLDDALRAYDNDHGNVAKWDHDYNFHNQKESDGPEGA